MFRGRSDGKRVRDLKRLREFIPYLQRTRTESEVFYRKQVVVEKALDYLEQINHGTDEPITLFHLFVAAGVRTFALRPELNRFVAGRRIYQRNDIIFSFAVKKSLTEEAKVSTAKIIFQPEDTLRKVAERVEREVKAKRGPAQSRDEKEMDTLLKMPRGITILALKLGALADYFGWLPRKMIENDPLFASMFGANLGSIGLDAVNHHLFNWGTVSLFVTMGKIYKAPVVDEGDGVSIRRVVDLAFTLDNRISDGLYLSNAIALFVDHVENPAKLELALRK